MDALEKRAIGLSSLQEAITTTNSSGRLIFHLFGALAEFERNLMRERTTAGLVAARARGRCELRDLIRKGKKPVALFVDEAHDLHCSTLTGLKRLIEVVEDGGGTLSVVLAGHPKLKNDLRRPTMEEIGYRATVFSLEGIVGNQRGYIEWLVAKCTTEDTQIGDILEPEAIVESVLSK